MRRKDKNTYKLFLVFGLVLFLSVGYAVVNSVSLTVSGTAGAGSETLDVSFNGTKTVSNTTKGSASVTAGATTATFKASDMTLNESITFTYTVQNKETDVAADVTMSFTNSNTSYFSVSIFESSSNSSSFSIGAGDTTNIYVVVKMIKTPIAEADNSATFNITINAEPVNLISFYVDGTEYYAKSGMTWAEWMSSYGYASGFGSNSTEVTYATSYVTDNYVTVKPTDVIKSGYTYNLVQD